MLVALCRPLKDSAYAAPATNKAIADEIHLSVDAVKAHLRVLFERFGLDELPQNSEARAPRGRSRWSTVWSASTNSDAGRCLTVRPAVEGPPQPDLHARLSVSVHIATRRAVTRVTAPRVLYHGGSAHGWEEVADRALRASALLLAGGRAAFAADDRAHPVRGAGPGLRPDRGRRRQRRQATTTRAEYKRVEDDGSISLNVFVTAEEKAALARQGLQDRSARSRTPTPARSAWRSARQSLDRGGLAADLAENGLPKGGAKFNGKSVVPTPGRHRHPAREHLHRRRRPGAAHDDGALPLRRGVQQVDQARRGHQRRHGPGAGALLRRPRRRATARAVNMGRFIDADPTPDEYMYHRQLSACPGVADLQDDRASPPRRPRAARRQHRDLPGHRVARQGPPAARRGLQDRRSSRSTRIRPRPARNLDALAAEYPELMSVVNMPEKTSGYQRKSQATMNGTAAIGSAAPTTLGPLLLDTTGEITAAQPVAKIPFTGTAGQAVRAIVDGIPAGLDRLHPDPQGPRRQRPAGDRHGHEPGDRSTRRSPRPAPTPTRSRASQGDLGDFTFKIQRVALLGRSCSPPRTGARTAATRSWPSSAAQTRQQPAAERRRQRQADRGLPRHGRHRRAELDGRRRSSPRSTPSRRPPRS